MTRRSQIIYGFTLVELLVVIAIIAILAAILFPVFNKTRAKARQTTCTTNQRQIALGLLLYVQEHDEVLPPSTDWMKVCTSDMRILKCPDNQRTNTSYTYNVILSNKDMARVSKPTETMMTVDGLHIPGSYNPNWAKNLVAWYSADVGITTDGSSKVTQWLPRNIPSTDGTDLPTGFYTSADIALRHSGQAVMSFVDGHMENRVTVPEAGDIGTGTPITQTDPSKAPTLDSSGILGKNSIDFDNTPPGQYLTIAAGVGINFNVGEYTIVQVRDMDNNGWQTILSAPGMVLRADVYHTKYGTLPANQSYATSGFPTTPTTLAFIATAIKSNGASWNINTTFASGATFTSNSIPLKDSNNASIRASFDGTAPLYLGADLNNWPPPNSRPAAMKLSQLLFYNKALNADEIQAVYYSLQLNGNAP
ncbi:MAG: prepilin-type N-terminal cleavage/methylation domain-containing protein [bacterium]